MFSGLTPNVRASRRFASMIVRGGSLSKAPLTTSSPPAPTSTTSRAETPLSASRSTSGKLQPPCTCRQYRSQCWPGCSAHPGRFRSKLARDLLNRCHGKAKSYSYRSDPEAWRWPVQQQLNGLFEELGAFNDRIAELVKEGHRGLAMSVLKAQALKLAGQIDELRCLLIVPKH
jgi:hypothetical protein